MHDEVIRGLRWGAILVAALAIGVACYRIARETPPAEAAPKPATPEIASKPIIQPSVPIPALPSATPVPVPPPIRKVARNIVRTTAPAASPAAIPAVEMRIIDTPEPIVESPAQVPAVGAPVAPAPAIEADKEPEPVRDSRGKRWLKAVGRWVRVVVKN